MKYYVVKLITNTAGQDASSISVFDAKDKALVHYHNTLASYHNADDVLYAVVSIMNGIGNIEIKEIVDHKPEPEPEPEPQPEEIAEE